MSADNRQNPRSSAILRIHFRSKELEQVRELFTSNVSQNGFFVRCKEPVPVGEKVRFEMFCKGQVQPIKGVAEVVWQRGFEDTDPDTPQREGDGPPGVGVRIVEVAQDSQRLLGQIAEPEPLDLDDLVEEDHPQDQDWSLSEKAPDQVVLPTSYSISETVIGIDLGTSNSCVAVIREGQPHVIALEDGLRTIPSVVGYTKDDKVLIGHTGREHLCVDPENTIYGAKRFIGRPFQSPLVQRLGHVFPYKITPGESGNVAIQVRDHIHSLEQISAHILGYLRDAAQSFVKLEVQKAIISVPAYYNDNQRQAVKEAGKLAGLDVLRIVNEPTAAALAYGFNEGLSKKILVFDLGGGTFDVSVLELKGNRFQVLATGGDNFLGGDDIDNALVEYVMKQYEKEHGVRIRGTRTTKEKLKQAVEKIKRILSDKEQGNVNAPYLETADEKTVNLQMPLTRELLKEIASPIVDRAFKICEHVLSQSNIDKAAIDDIILVGGQTRMPYIRETILKRFGKKPHQQVNPDEAVALGAALLGASVHQIDSLQLRDAISIGIGIALPGGRFKTIIPANTQVPVVRKYSIPVESQQQSYTIDIFQGEFEQVSENEYLGTLLFSDLQVVEGQTGKINIEFHVTEECILKVIASDPATGKEEEALLVTYDTPPSIKQSLQTPMS